MKRNMKSFFLSSIVAWAFLAGSLTSSTRAEDTLRLSVTALPIQLGNPYRSSGIPAIFVVNQVFDALTNTAADGSPEPWLATSWQAEDPNTWVFTLRDNVTFSNGVPFDANAVVFALNYLTSEEALVELVSNELRNVASASVRDRLSVEIKTHAPDILLPRLLSMMSIVEPGEWQRLGREGFAQQPVGTGPFQVTSWGPQRADLAAFRGSWRAPKVDKLEVLALPERATRIQALQSGRIDIAMILGPDDIAAVEQSGDVMEVYPLGGVMGFAFVTSKPGPVQDVRVRRALNLAVNKEAIILGLLQGAGAPSGQPVTAATFGHDPSIAPFPYDPEAARALLEEAGYPDGLTLMAEVVPGTITADATIFQQVAADLARVGVTLNVQAVTFPTFSRHYRTADWDGDMFGMYYNADPYLDGLRPMKHHSCWWQAPWYCDEAIMPVMLEALETFDVEERRRLTQQVMQFYHDQATAIYVSEVRGFIGLSKRLKGFRVVNNFLHLHDVTVD